MTARTLKVLFIAISIISAASWPAEVQAGTGQVSEPRTTEPEPIVSEQKIGNRTYAVGSILVKAKKEKIWAIIADYENSPQVFPSVKRARILKDHGANKLVRQNVCPKGSPMHFDYEIEINENAPNRMEWHRTKGALKELAGSWQLVSDGTENNTLITYSIYIDGGLFLPAWLLRGQSKNLLPEVLKSVKQIAERTSADASTASSGKS